MIKRITNPLEFKTAVNDIFDLFDLENSEMGHALLKHDKDHIISAYADKSLLAWDFFVWVNLSEEGKYDGIIAFANHKNEKFGEEIFTEYIWLSKNSMSGFKLLSTAIKFARKKEFKYIIMSTAVKHPKSEKISRFYERMGFLKDSITYIAKL
jgi:GNAT superfamily N-acetyltransferase|tara:strand:+ start:351 stop:809 length:459 start_codon:yes stop_codon:yes gene_type:complete